MTQMVTRREAAEALNVSRMSILRWIRAGKLPAVKVGRDWKIRADVIEAIQQHGLQVPEAA